MNTFPEMYFITAVKTLVLLLLCSGYFDFTFSSHLRYFKLINLDTFPLKCLEENQSRVTVYDEKDAKVVNSLTGVKTYWLGLEKKNISSTWSDGAPYDFKKSKVNVSDWDPTCEAMDISTWKGFNCSEEKSFMCNKDYTLIEEMMSWCKARQYCKKKHTDLVSISNDTENMKVMQNGKNKSFWIGLLHDNWEWQDKGCSPFRKWGNNNAAEDGEKFTVLFSEGQARSWMKFSDNSQAFSICSSGTTRIIVIEKNFTWEQAFYHCNAYHDGLLWIEDKQDHDAVEQWLVHSNFTGTFWMGLRQSRVFGFWIWTSDHIVSYSNWTNGVQPELPLSKHCGVIKTDDYKWHDENCLVPHYFLCEEEMIKLD